jgi:hypothetical protein
VLHVSCCMRQTAGLFTRSGMACGRHMQNSMHDILAIRIGNGCQRRCWTLSRCHARSVIVRDQHGSAQRAACQIARIQSDIAGGKSATDVVRDYLRTADLQEPTLRSFISLDSAGALQQVGSRPPIGQSLCLQHTGSIWMHIVHNIVFG